MRILLFSFLILHCTGCVYSRVTTTCQEPTPDAGVVDDGSVSSGDYILSTLFDSVSLSRSTSVDVEVVVDRDPGYSEPVLVELWGLPDGVFVQPRENRMGDPGGMTRLVLRASEESWTGETNIAVRGSDGQGLQHTLAIHLIVTE